ncbi:MAG: hypothetical protein ABFD60_16825 [Bryobacteraceae bacterium]
MKLHIVFIARGLAILWAVFWLFFFVAESWVWHTPALVAAPWAGAGLLFVMLALIPWRWERGGGRLLVAVGVLLGVAYAIWAPAGLSIASRAITTIVLGGPPILAGLLFLRGHR